MNLPNLLTILRIMLVPAILAEIARGGFATAFGLFLAAGATDFLDGFIARRFGLATRLGAILDPLADKVLIVSSVLLLAWIGRLPWWLALAVIGRDFVILAGAGAWYRKAGRLPMEPSWPSKTNTGVLVLLVGLVIAHGARLFPVAFALPSLFLLALATTLFSGLHYVAVWGRRARAL